MKIVALDPLRDVVVITELIEAGQVLASEVTRLQTIIKDSLDTVDCYDQAEGAQELHELLEECQGKLYESGLAAVNTDGSGKEAL